MATAAAANGLKLATETIARNRRIVFWGMALGIVAARFARRATEEGCWILRANSGTRTDRASDASSQRTGMDRHPNAVH